LCDTIITVLLAIFLASILELFSKAIYRVDTAARLPLATSPTRSTLHTLKRVYTVNIHYI